METDIEHFRSKLGKIEGANEVGEKLLEVVKAKTIASQPEKPEPANEKQPEKDDASDSSRS